MTFDSLEPNYKVRNSVTVSMSVAGPVPFAFSPTYGTGTHTINDGTILGDPEQAINRSVMMTPERRSYLLGRWRYWVNISKERQLGTRRIGLRGIGIE